MEQSQGRKQWGLLSQFLWLEDGIDGSLKVLAAGTSAAQLHNWGSSQCRKRDREKPLKPTLVLAASPSAHSPPQSSYSIYFSESEGNCSIYSVQKFYCDQQERQATVGLLHLGQKKKPIKHYFKNKYPWNLVISTWLHQYEKLPK